MAYLTDNKQTANQNQSQNTSNNKTLQRKGKSLMPPNAQNVLQLKAMIANSLQPQAIQLKALQEQMLHSPEGQRVQQLKAIIASSPQMQRAAQLQAMANNYAAQRQAPVQRMGKEEELLQGKFSKQAPVQRMGKEEEMLQGKFSKQTPIQRMGKEEELLQGKFFKQTPIQRMGKEEELLQGKFSKQAPVQRMGKEEELLQGKFSKQAPVQRMGKEEELLQGKFSKQAPVQRMGKEEELLQGKFSKQAPIQRMGKEEEMLQGKFENENSSNTEAPIQRQLAPNNTGLPDNLKSGIENLSGYSIDDVNVHYNSDKPAQLQAHAYAQGTDIHLGTGQEKHLPHEAWHVVQQKQGRVKPTMQMKGKVNDDKGLEREADVMGARAIQGKFEHQSNLGNAFNSYNRNLNIIQKFGFSNPTTHQKQQAGTCGLYSLLHNIMGLYPGVSIDAIKTALLTAAGEVSKNVTFQGEIGSFADLQKIVTQYNTKINAKIKVSKIALPIAFGKKNRIKKALTRERFWKDEKGKKPSKGGKVGAMVAIDSSIFYHALGFYPGRIRITKPNPTVLDATKKSAASPHWVKIKSVTGGKVSILDSNFPNENIQIPVGEFHKLTNVGTLANKKQVWFDEVFRAKGTSKKWIENMAKNGDPNSDWDTMLGGGKTINQVKRGINNRYTNMSTKNDKLQLKNLIIKITKA